MAQASPASQPDIGIHPGDLRLVLFGMPAAGKSSLLGALSQAAQTQQHLLNGRLNDLSRGLEELQERLYVGGERRTAEEVVPYPLTFTPFDGDGQDTGRKPLEAAIIDCDGRVANDLLVRRQGIPHDSPEGTLAYEVANADAIILVVDAAAPTSQIDADFTEFDRFLRHMERSRSQRAEVGGLPVFLVLTKCDLLANDTDSSLDWVEKIEERKREVDDRFRRFLARREEEEGPLPFGQIDLHLWATAVKRPALAANPEKPREPYGVAELFRLALEQGSLFQKREKQAGQRLWWTVGIAASLLILLSSLIVYQVGKPPPSIDPLELQVQRLRYDDHEEAAQRLGASREVLRDRVVSFTEIKDNPRFSELPDTDQEWVTGRLSELQSYLDYRQLVTEATRPGEATSLAQVKEVVAGLEKLEPPQQDWGQTSAVRLRNQLLEDARALEEAATQARTYFLAKTEAGNVLWSFIGLRSEAGIAWRRWDDQVRTLLGETKEPPFPPMARVPGSPSGLSYATVLNLDEVRSERNGLDTVRANLEQLRRLCAALGLIDPTPEYPPVLVIPRDFTLTQARERVQELQSQYPDHAREFFEPLPEAIRAKVRETAQLNYEYLLPPAQQRILEELANAGVGKEETRERWLEVAHWLSSDPAELKAWRELADILRRLADPSRLADPVKELAAFLEKSSFLLTIDRLQLKIPNRLKIQPERNATFNIYLRAVDSPAVKLMQSSVRADDLAEVKVYTFYPEKSTRLEFRPGDDFYAQLKLHGDRVLTWNRGRSRQYRFEKLLRKPRLHKEGEPLGGTLEGEIKLLLTPPDGIPSVPDLLPVVKFAD